MREFSSLMPQIATVKFQHWEYPPTTRNIMTVLYCFCLPHCHFE